MSNTVLSTAYWPNLHYFYHVLNSENIFIEKHEHYQKQSFRNRTQILTANGILDLTIPVIKKNDKEIIKDIEVSYAEPWQTKHWRAISTAYKNSPYFEFFEDEIKPFYINKPQFLLEYNTDQLTALFKIFRKKQDILFTNIFEKEIFNSYDLRNSIHPKINSAEDHPLKKLLETPYYQTFQDKFKFIPNLSILDLLFNTGLDTLTYLK